MQKRDFDPAATGPLGALRVLDLSRLVAGNVLTLQLADFGAEVIKIEPPGGDTLRQWTVAGIPTAWKVYARNKKSIALDLHQARARELVLELAAGAHCLVESFRPGTLEAMGLGPQVLLERNPRLVIVRISGWGQDGPYSRRPGFGTLVEGMSGFAAMNGFADREPLLPPFYLADAVAGLYGVGAVMIALREVEVQGGKGQVIDLPLLDPLISVLGAQAANYQITGRVKPRTGNRSTNSAPRNAYVCSDGQFVCLSASTQQMTERLFRAIGRPALISDPRFRSNQDRLENWQALDAIIAQFIVQRSQQENVAFFERAEVTIGPILDISQIVEDRHVRERGILLELPDQQAGQIAMHAPVPRLSGTPGVLRRPAPRLGEHNRQVLGALGLDTEALDALAAAGVIVEEA
jgi:crotonobetainyl-CoA:carnitine CoA-transferase CaiB-like acyl-CoA transferase